MSNEPGEQPGPGLSGNQDPGWIPGQSQQGPEGGGYWQGQAPPGVPPYGPGYWPPYHPGYGATGGGWAYGPPPPGPAGWPGPGGHYAGGPRHGRRALVAVGGVAALLVAGTVGGFIGNAIGSSGAAAPRFSAVPSNPGSGFGSGPGGSFGGLPFGGSSSSGSGSASSTGSGPANASAIAARVDRGLVDVNTTIDYGSARAAGTGMVLTPGGVVLTNNHVIDGATSISVTDVGNGKTYRAHVAGYDPTKDVAILKLSGAANLQTVTIARSAAVPVGQKVVGIGNAGGAGGTPSYAGGTVTATGQSIPATDDLTGTTEHLTGMIETNAGIQAGDSGGPLVNTSGQVIGMDTAGSQSVQTTSQQATDGFAIPIGTATGIGTQILDAQHVTGVHLGPTAFLGVEVGQHGSGSGVPIAGVVSGKPAARAGLAAGDVITSVDGHQVTSQTALQRVMVTEVTPGQNVTVGYTTGNGQQHSVSVVLASGPPA